MLKLPYRLNLIFIFHISFLFVFNWQSKKNLSVSLQFLRQFVRFLRYRHFWYFPSLLFSFRQWYHLSQFNLIIAWTELLLIQETSRKLWYHKRKKVFYLVVDIVFRIYFLCELNIWIIYTTSWKFLQESFLERFVLFFTNICSIKM